MIGPIGHKAVKARTLMGRLRSDVRGNTLAIMAISLIPMCALAGSGVDTARMYVVKVRLQQACDAGVLAGRKAMQANGALNSAAVLEAKTFFANNFNSGFMGTAGFKITDNPYPFTPVQTADNQVAATAITTVPMTIMKMFGAAPVKMTVTCQARFDVADSDIMFVLDTTGSMSDKPDGTGGGNTKQKYTRENGADGWFSPEASSGSKISGLRTAVVHFYDTVAASADPSTHIRYGFVPYSVSVNVGAAIRSLNPSYLVDQWNYNTRVPAGESKDTVWSTSSTSTDNKSSSSCTTGSVRTPATGYVITGSYPTATATATKVTTSWTSRSDSRSPGTCTVKTDKLKGTWTYKNAQIDVSQIKNGTGPDVTRYGTGNITWLGCIEERETAAPGTKTFSDTVLNPLPADLNPDMMPDSDAHKWKPALPELSYWRGNNTSWDNAGSSNTSNSDSTATGTSAGSWIGSQYTTDAVACPKAAKRLSVMSRDDVVNYVAATGDLRPSGYTYHDAGMIWGTRMLAPNGPFGADTASWPGRNTPNRYIVFMTDGEMTNVSTAYHLYGIEKYDGRIGGSDGDTTYHNARFLAECAAAKSRGISVFVVGYGQPIVKGDPLDTCASPGQAIYASDVPALDAAFQKIAKQVALLRLSQ